MDLEKLIAEIKTLNPYQLQILKNQLEARNDRKMLETVGRLLLGVLALLLWQLSK